MFEEIIAACRRNWVFLPDEVKNAINAFDTKAPRGLLAKYNAQQEALMDEIPVKFHTGDEVLCGVSAGRILAVLPARHQEDSVNRYVVLFAASDQTATKSENELKLSKRRASDD